MPSDAPDPTELLRSASAGESSAAEALYGLVQDELTRVARALMSSERGEHTLQATALVNEAWLRLFKPGAAYEWSDRAHFLRTAAAAMRHVLVDHARARGREKRGGGMPVALDAALDELKAGGEIDVVALHDALERFAHIDPQGARIVELRFFAGLTIDETARVLELSTPTIERSWRTARLWLARALGPDSPSEQAR